MTPHAPIAFRAAYLIIGSSADAQDAAQEALVKAWLAIDRFRPGAPFRPWLLQIVVNEARNRRRRSLVLGIMLAVLLAGTAVAIPPVRHAVERVFGINGAVVERVPKLPPLPKGASGTLNLGRPIPVAGARHAASFTALLPPGAVSAAYVSNDVPGGRISLTVRRMLVIEFRGGRRPSSSS